MEEGKQSTDSPSQEYNFIDIGKQSTDSPSQEYNFIDSIIEHPAILPEVELSHIQWDVSSVVLKSFIDKDNQTAPAGTEVDEGNTSTTDAVVEPTYIMSDVYSLGTAVGKPSCWKLMINPSHMENGTRYISMYLWMCQLDPPNEHVDVIYRFNLLSALNTEQVLLSKASGIRRFGKTSPSFGWDKFISYEKLGSQLTNTISFKAKVRIYSDPKEAPIPKGISSGCPVNVGLVEETGVEPMDVDSDDKDDASKANTTKNLKDERVRNHVAELWLSKANSDVKIVVKDIKIPAHWDVLKARSPIFEKHFKGRNRSYRMDGNNIDVVEAVLEYCYTGTITKVLSYDNKVELLNVAIFLQMYSLRNFAMDMIISGINDSNFTLIYELMKNEKDYVGEYSMERFLKFLLQFRKKNPNILASYKQHISTYASIIL